MKFPKTKLKLILLAISSFGMATFTQAADNVATQELETVNVNASANKETAKVVRAAKSYSIASDGDLRDRVNLGVLGKANAFTAPITVVNYDEKVINNTEARTLVDVVAKNDASTWQFGGESNTLTGLYFRGYQLDARQFSVNGLAGMYGTQGTASVHVGSAQLIKGASTAVNGMDPEGAVSGAVNIETKKASDKGNRKVGLAYFSKNRVQGTADIGQRFGENKEYGVRFNTKLRHGDTPRDGYSEDDKEFSLNADYRGEKLRVQFDSVYAKRKTNGGRARIQDIQDAQGKLFSAPDGKTNLVPSWQYQNTTGKTNMLTFEYDTDHSFQITGGIGYNDATYKGIFTSPTTTADGTGYNIGTNGKGARFTDQRFKTLSTNLSARGEFFTGSVSHNWSTALDFVNRKRLTYNGAQVSDTTAIYPYNGTSIQDQLKSVKSSLKAIDYASGPATDEKIKVTSLALSDTLGLLNNKLRLTLGGRYQMVKQTNTEWKDAVGKPSTADAKRFSPMAMIAWLPRPDLVFYGNYMEDLEPGKIDEDADTMPKPRVSKQFEVGVRKNWGDVVTTLNAFQITRPGYWLGSTKEKNGTKVPTYTNSDFAKYYNQGGLSGDEQGKERNRGIEFNIYANLMNKTLRPNFGLMYLNSKVKDYPNYKDMLVNDGVQVANPKIIAKAGIEWDTPFLQGLTLNGAVQYIGKSYQDTQKKYEFPAYALVDVGARYAQKLGNNQKLTYSATIENLFNKNYWQIQRGQYDRSFAVVGMPRTFWVKADYEF